MERDIRDSELYESRFEVKARRSNARFYLLIMIIVLAMLGFRLYWTTNFGGVTVDGGSMRNTFVSGEQLVMKYVDGEKAQRGDVIVVYVGDYEEFNDPVPESQKTKYLIKRLIAIEGDTVYCKDGVVMLKKSGSEQWEALDEPYAYYTDKKNYDFGEYVVQEGEIFFLGDNRNHSQDSRFGQPHGSRLDRLYKVDDIVGVVPTWAIEYKAIFQKILFWNV